MSSSIAATICLIALCAASSAPTISSSVASFAPASTIMIASALPATIRSILLFLRSGNVGLMRYSPSMKPTRTPAMVFSNGIEESARAADAPVIASTSESLSESAEINSATICVS